MKNGLSRILWIGGSPCAGKSSITDLLAGRLNVGAYHLDEHYNEHLARATEQGTPRMARARSITWNELWSRSVSNLLASEFEFYDEEFGMIVDDVRQIQEDRAIIAEGTGMLPKLVAPLLEDCSQAVWLVPTARFQLEYYGQRDWVDDVLNQCDDPKAAFDHWMGREIAFAKRIADEVNQLGLTLIVVDGTESMESVARKVEERFRATALLNEPDASDAECLSRAQD